MREAKKYISAHDRMTVTVPEGEVDGLRVRRWQQPTVAALTVLLQSYDRDPERDMHGYRIMKDTRYGASTIYPMLNRLADGGWLLDRRERRNVKGRIGDFDIVYYRINPDCADTIRRELARRASEEETSRDG